jgi:hypothetical protein
MVVMFVTIAVVLVGGVLVTLAWWKLGDKWVNEEQRRFRVNPPRTREGIVVRRDFDDRPPA